jgi:acyl dehydratase
MDRRLLVRSVLAPEGLHAHLHHRTRLHGQDQAGERPILHGLATYGVIGHGLMAELCDYEPERVLALEGRFSSAEFPGETITVDIWRQEPGCAAFRARVAARDTIVFTNGLFEYAA